MSKDYKIYMYENITNHKKYIGQTCLSLSQRAGKNGIKYKNCIYFYKAIQKYGWENFSSIILEEGLTLEEANQKEQEYINLYNTQNENYGYNLRDAGSQGHLANSTKQKISNSIKGTQHPNYGKGKKIRCVNTGQIFDNANRAAEWCINGDRNHIRQVANHSTRLKTNGKHPITGESLKWEFVEEEATYNAE